MLEIIDRHLANMRAQKTESTEMALRYDGAVQILEIVRNEVVAGILKTETNDGDRSPVPAPAAEGEATDAPVVDIPRKAARRKRSK